MINGNEIRQKVFDEMLKENPEIGRERAKPKYEISEEDQYEMDKSSEFVDRIDSLIRDMVEHEENQDDDSWNRFYFEKIYEGMNNLLDAMHTESDCTTIWQDMNTELDFRGITLD